MVAPEGPGNITETWNFTQAFNFPKIIHASTPNARRSVYRPPPSDEYVFSLYCSLPSAMQSGQFSQFQNRTLNDTGYLATHYTYVLKYLHHVELSQLELPERLNSSYRISTYMSFKHNFVLDLQVSPKCQPARKMSGLWT